MNGVPFSLTLKGGLRPKMLEKTEFRREENNALPNQVNGFTTSIFNSGLNRNLSRIPNAPPLPEASTMEEEKPKLNLMG